MPKNKGAILPKANREEMQDFVREYAEKDNAFSVALGQWLLKKYSQHENKAEAYVAQVEQLFCLMEDKFRSSKRWRYDDIGLDWDSIDVGMEKLADTLRDKLTDGVTGVVVPPVLRFYQLLGEHEDDFMSEEDGDISAATEICEQLLLAWVQQPTEHYSARAAKHLTSHFEIPPSSGTPLGNAVSASISP